MKLLHSGMQAAASSVNFLTGSHVLASAGLDEQLMLLDRRSNSVAASVSAGRPLHAMACRDDGMTIAAGTSGACLHCMMCNALRQHHMLWVT